MFGHALNPHYFANPPGVHVRAALLFARLVRRPRRRVGTPSRTPDRGLHARARRRRACSGRSRCGCCTSPARGCSAARVGPARGGDRGGRVPAGLLLAPGAQRRADAGAADAVAARQRRRAAQRARARLRCSPGSGWGSACATKYTGGIVLVPLLAAAAAGCSAAAPPRRDGAAALGAAPAALALAAFLRRQPLRAARLHGASTHELVHQSTLSAEAQGKLGAPQSSGARLLPVVAHLGARLGAGAPAALGGASGSGARDRRLGWLLVPGAAAVPAVHGPAGPLLRPLADADLPDSSCLLAAYLRGVRRVDALAAGAGAVAARRRCWPARSARCALLRRRGSSTSVHSASCCRAPDTRNLRARLDARAHAPPARRSWSSRSSPDEWAQDIGTRRALTANGNRWVEVPAQPLEHRQRRLGASCGRGRDRQHRGLRAHAQPGADRLLRAQRLLLGRQRLDAARPRRGRPERGAAGDRLLPRARAPRRSRLPRPRPTARRGPVAFNFDWSFDYYPLAYDAAGPDDDGLPPARRPVRGAAERGALYPGSCRCGAAAPTPTRQHLARAIELADARARARQAEPASSAPWSSRDGEVLGEGWHDELRRRARRGQRDRGLRRARTSSGATLYVSLEPCCHEGKTPPCTDAILAGGHHARRRRLRRPDREGLRPRPRDPARRGRRGRRRRRRARRARAAAQPGLPQARAHRAPVGAVQVGDDARRQGRHAHRRLASGSPARPAASSRTAGAPSVDAVVVGIGTALADDPQLTARIEGRSPSCASRAASCSTRPARLPLDSQLVARRREIPLTVVVSRAAPRARDRRARGRRRRGARRDRRERARARALGARPARRRAASTSILLEGGPHLAGAFLDAGEIDEVRLFLAPLLLGGSAARDPLEGEGVEQISEALRALTLRLRARRRRPADLRAAAGVVSDVHRARRGPRDRSRRSTRTRRAARALTRRDAGWPRELGEGDSVAVNGVCLTATGVDDGDASRADVDGRDAAALVAGRARRRARRSTSSCRCAPTTAWAATSCRATSTASATVARDRARRASRASSRSTPSPSCCATWSRRARSPSTASA